MKYSQQRDYIHSGHLLAWTHRSWKSWYDIKVQIVRFFTQSEYSHVGVAWRIGGRLFVIEAVVPQVRIYPLSRLGSFYHIPVAAHWTPEVTEFALQQVGKPYSQWKAIKSFFGPVKQDSYTECAETAIVILASAGVNLGVLATPTAVVREALNGATLTLITN